MRTRPARKHELTAAQKRVQDLQHENTLLYEAVGVLEAEVLRLRSVQKVDERNGQ